MSDEPKKQGFLDGILEGVAKKVPPASPPVIEAERLLEGLNLSPEDKAMLAGRLMGNMFTDFLSEALADDADE